MNISKDYIHNILGSITKHTLTIKIHKNTLNVRQFSPTAVFMDFYVLLYLFMDVLLFFCYPKQNNRNMSKEIVRLRRKELSQGGCSLYLDIYKAGVRKYEFLKLYLVPERTRQDKQTNKETLRIAEAVKAQRIVEIERDGFNLSKTSTETVADWFVAELERKRREGMMITNLQNTLSLVRDFFGRTMLKDLTRDKVILYKEHIAQMPNISKNTKHAYFSCFKAAVNQGIRKGKIKADALVTVGGLPSVDSNREFLTMDEVRRLAATDCKDGGLKRAFLFSCLTGLRSIDIVHLVWGNVSTVGGFTRLTFKQQKTGVHEYTEINPQAAALLGERGADGERVFADFRKNTKTSAKLAAWVKSAGIGKHITFHCARHTFAVMMLELGVNIAVIQKLLGHRDLATTLIYAKVLDKTKREAVTMIPQLI